MKLMYWSPKKASRSGLAAIALVAIVGLIAVEWCRQYVTQPHHEQKVAAAHNAAAMISAIKAERIRRGYVIDPELDPYETGIIGEQVTSATTAVGHVRSKQASANPNMAAAVVEMLKQAGVERGDVVAVGYTGSFPAGNIAALAAIDTLGLEPIILGSVGSSQYGANDPDFLWPDMEKLLRDQGHTKYRMLGCSMGGPGDRALGLADDGKQAIHDSIRRTGVKAIGGVGFDESIDERMAIYDQYAGDRPIKVYLNVGGGTLSVGRRLGKSLYKLGLNSEAPTGSDQVNGIIPRFFARGTPVVHLVGFDRLAKRHGIVAASGGPTAIGVGDVYAVSKYNPWLAAGVLIAILAGLKFFVLSDAGERVCHAIATRTRPPSEPPVFTVSRPHASSSTTHRKPAIKTRAG